VPRVPGDDVVADVVAVGQFVGQTGSDVATSADNHEYRTLDHAAIIATVAAAYGRTSTTAVQISAE